MIVIAEEGLQGAERRCRAATGIATAGPDDDRARLNLFQLEAAAGGMDGERAPALEAGRADHAVPLQHGADPQRVDGAHGAHGHSADLRSEEHTSELQSLMRISYAVVCLKK